jgi:peptidyl-prolyl cis-trans isomerase C
MAELDFSLPESGRRGPGWIRTLALVVLSAGAAVAVWSLASAPPKAASPSRNLSPDALKALAAKLEDRGLYRPAAEAWREYLAAADLEPEPCARAWFNVGELYRRAGRFEDAASAYYRSEAVQKVSELAPELQRRLVECLERMGRFAGLRREIEMRTSLAGDAATGGEVVAEIGPRKITGAELDRLIQEDVDRQADALAIAMPSDRLNEFRKRMLDRFKGRAERLAWLEQYLAEEILYREAVEQGLPDKPEVERLADHAVRQLLAQQLILREVGARAALTESEIANAYAAAPERYREPEKAEISHILVAGEREANQILADLKAGKAFEALAREKSLDEATKEKGGAVAGSITKGQAVPGVGFSSEFLAAVFDTAEGQVAGKPVRTDKGWHVILVRKRIPARQKPLGEVRDQVVRELMRTKQREFQEQLLESLKTKHRVILHRSSFQDAAKEADEQKPDSKP